MSKSVFRVCLSFLLAFPLLCLALPFAYIPDTANSAINIVDVATNSAAGSLSPGGQPLAVELLPNGRSLYVINQGQSGLARYDLTYNTAPTGAPTANVATTSAPTAIASTPDSKYIWLSLQGTTSIVRMNVADNTFNTPLEIGFAPGPLAISESGSTLFVAENGGTHLAQINISADVPVLSTTISNLSGPATALALNSNASLLFASITGSNSINVRNTSALSTELGPITGAIGVKGLLVSGTTLYAGTTNAVMAWATADRSSLPTLTTTGTASWLGTNQDRSTLYTADNAGNWANLATGITPDTVYPVLGRFIGPYQAVFKFSASTVATSANSALSLVGSLPTFIEKENIGTTVTIKVIRLGDTTGSATVNYSTEAFGLSYLFAQPVKDYTEASGTLTFAAGESEKIIPVQLIDDALFGNTEYFHLFLSQATGYSQLGSSSENQAQFGIENDDPDPRDRAGCSLGTGTNSFDPTLWMMVILSALVVLRRKISTGK